jgi:hypothetical protein
VYKLYHYNFINEDFSVEKYRIYGTRLSPENLKYGWGNNYLRTAEEVRAEFAEVRAKAIKYKMITIYTIAYNEEIFIQFMIDHYRSRFPNCHIVVYDNESTDNTVAIAKANNCEVITYCTNNQIQDRKYLEIKNNCWKKSKTPAPWRPPWCHGARHAVAAQGAGATRRRRGGEKGLYFSYPPTSMIGTTPSELDHRD